MSCPEESLQIKQINPAFFEADGLKTFECVIANPPFFLKEWGAENWENDPFGRNIVEEALADLSTAWEARLQAEEKFKSILKNYI